MKQLLFSRTLIFLFLLSSIFCRLPFKTSAHTISYSDFKVYNQFLDSKETQYYSFTVKKNGTGRTRIVIEWSQAPSVSLRLYNSSQKEIPLCNYYFFPSKCKHRLVYSLIPGETYCLTMKNRQNSSLFYTIRQMPLKPNKTPEKTPSISQSKHPKTNQKVTSKPDKKDSLSLSKHFIILPKGNTYRLTARLQRSSSKRAVGKRDLPITWYSTNPSVVTVSSGSCYGRKAGIAVITCSFKKGSARSASCTIKVT